VLAPTPETGKRVAGELHRRAQAGRGGDLGGARPGLKDAILGFRGQLEKAFPEGKENVYSSPSNFRPERLGPKLKQVEDRLKGAAVP